jgi:hypothetical protein
MKGLPVLQTRPHTEIITICDKSIQTVQVKFWLPVVFHSVCQKVTVLASPFISKDMPKTAAVLKSYEPLMELVNILAHIWKSF